MVMRRWLLTSALVIASLGSQAAAQEVQWRTDYDGAVRESAEKKRPLFLDIGKDNCLHCVKLDMSTFRDPSLSRLLNENCIPVKVDGERNTVQIQGQTIHSFPTLVMIGTDNRVLLIQEGYVDAGSLLPPMQKILAGLAPRVAAAPSNPPAAQPPAPATAQAQTPSQPVPQNLGVQGNAAAPAQAQAKRGTTSPFQADTKIGPTDGRAPIWPRDGTARVAPPTYQPVEERMHRAKQLLSVAQEDYQRQQWLACLEHCKSLMLLYPDMQESLEARQMALRIKSNPDLLERLGRDLTENLAEVYWELAQTKLRLNQASQAIPFLEKIVQSCPGSRFAPAAQDYLARLSVSAARPTRIGVRTH